MRWAIDMYQDIISFAGETAVVRQPEQACLERTGDWLPGREEQF
jgi:hypothetical protein